MPSSSSKRTRRPRPRKSTAEICAPSSFRVKYACPDPGMSRLESSPSTQNMAKCSSRDALIITVTYATVSTFRSTLRTELAGCAAQRVLHEHGDGHGADAAGHGGNGAHPRGGGLEVHVARELARVQAVHPDVDDHRAFLDHVARDEARA